MSDFNKVILLGRIGNDPELKNSAQGKPYLKLSLATNDYRGGEEKKTSWHRVMVFGTQAQNCATYLRKGAQVMVDGILENRVYTNDEGKKISQVSVLANRVQFLSRSKGGSSNREMEEQADSYAMAESSETSFATH